MEPKPTTDLLADLPVSGSCLTYYMEPKPTTDLLADLPVSGSCLTYYMEPILGSVAVSVTFLNSPNVEKFSQDLVKLSSQ